MERPLRIEYRGAYYHVTSRGNERKAIFRDDADREKFIESLGRAVQDFDVRGTGGTTLQCFEQRSETGERAADGVPGEVVEGAGR
jgi:hypothetical protein